VTKYHLNDAELAAIRIYTVDDFKYINPAMAGIQSWMESQIPKISGAKNPDTSKSGIAKAMQEGRRHGQTVLAGMKKMPDYDGDLLYRGSSEDVTKIKSSFAQGSTIRYDAFVSCSTDRTVSEGFMKDNMDEDNRKAGKQGLLLKLEFKHSGKDVSMLSALAMEKEILLMPGVEFKVTGVEEDQKMTGKDGVEFTYHVVTATQTAK
jgi:hypothetical protein